MDVDATDTAAIPDVGQIFASTLPEHVIPSPPPGEAFFVAITRTAREAMDMHARSSREVEVGGILLGRPCRAGERPLLLIDAIIPALAAESRNANVTFTAETWTQVHAAIDRDHPGASIVGWYHTHPRFGIFLSDMDVFIQRHFFDLPHQVAVVIDPVANDEGVFIWQDGVPTRSMLHAELAPVVEITPKSVAAAAAPFAGAMAYASEDVMPSTEFMDALRQHVSDRRLRKRGRSAPILKHVRAAIDAFERFDISQKLALAALAALVAIIFCCLGYVLLDGSPHGTGVPMKTSTSDHPSDVRE